MRTLVFAMALAAAASLAAAAPLAAAAQEFSAGDLVVERPWATPPIGGQNQTSAYLVIRNDGDAADRLIAAHTEAARIVEFHATVEEHGASRMVHRSAVDAPAGGATAFAPGGLHMMLIDLAHPLAPEDSFPLTLEFGRAGAVEVTVKVESLADHLRAEAAEAGELHDHGED